MVTTVREMCEKLKVVVGSDPLSKEAQVRAARAAQQAMMRAAGALGLGTADVVCVIPTVCQLPCAVSFVAPLAHCKACKPTQQASPAALMKLTALPPPFSPPQRNATLLWFCLLRSTFASKRVLSEYKLTEEAFRWLTGEVSNK